MTSKRRALLVINPSRDEAILAAKELAELLIKAQFSLVTTSDIDIQGIDKISISELPDVEVAIVLGGDGTILRAAEIARLSGIPILGVNLGRVGFLAEVEKFSIKEVSQAVINKSFVLDQRMMLAYSVERNGKEVSAGFALNEITVERSGTAMVDLFLQIDSRPLSRWGCDGIICATPTGSTAYAFSAGGPILWPEVQALVLLPISPHALFSRPMVVSPSSQIVIEIESNTALLSADALRQFSLIAGDRVCITRDDISAQLAHIQATTFTDRLVAKFKLPVEGWRGE
jgi:NAD+ kinase